MKYRVVMLAGMGLAGLIASAPALAQDRGEAFIRVGAARTKLVDKGTIKTNGVVDPAVQIDVRASATPRAMAQLVGGIYQGRWLTPASRAVIVGAMERCRTGTHRMKALLPDGAAVAHKTGTLNNTASDIGVITTPDGRRLAVAIYVTGQGGHAGRDAKIASLGRAIYDGYLSAPIDGRQYASASYGGQP